MDRMSIYQQLADLVSATAGQTVTVADVAHAVNESKLVLGTLSWTTVDATPGSRRWKIVTGTVTTRVQEASATVRVQLDVCPGAWAIWMVRQADVNWSTIYATGGPMDGYSLVGSPVQLSPDGLETDEAAWAWIADQVAQLPAVP